MTLGISQDTSRFVCDNIARVWEQHLKWQYPDAHTLVILCDGGGSNSSAHLWCPFKMPLTGLRWPPQRRDWKYMFTLTQKLMTSSDRLTNRTRRGLPGRLSSPRNSVSGTTLSNRSTDATNFLHITKSTITAIKLLILRSFQKTRLCNSGLKAKKHYLWMLLNMVMFKVTICDFGKKWI